MNYNQMFPFLEFMELLVNGNIAAATKLVTPLNTHEVSDDRGYGILYWFCSYAPDTQESVNALHEILEIGCPVFSGHDWSILHVAVYHDKPIIARALLDLGNVEVQIDKVDQHGNTPLYLALTNEKWRSAKLLLDAGANLESVGTCRHAIVACEFVAARLKARTASVAMLGLKHCQCQTTIGCNGKDVLRVIARCIWESRGHDEWQN